MAQTLRTALAARLAPVRDGPLPAPAIVRKVGSGPTRTEVLSDSVTLYLGDCADVLPGLRADAVVTDSPYGLGAHPDPMALLQAWTAGEPYVPRSRGGFMGKEWDAFVPGPELWAPIIDTLPPGGHVLAAFGTRTYDLGALAIRLTGVEIRDMVSWLYGQGFPKSLDVSKAIASGTGRPEDIRRMVMGDAYEPSGRGRVNYDHGAASAMNGSTAEYRPATDAAREWEGWGTALKPACEPWVLARKPLIGTVAQTVQAHRTGALHIDACRVPGEKPVTWSTPRGGIWQTDAAATGTIGESAQGRWPSNVVHDGSPGVLAGFPDAKGQQGRALTDGTPQGNATYGALRHVRNVPEPRVDTDTSAARFFFEAKGCYGDEWPDLNPLPDPANIAAALSCPSRQLAGSVLANVVNAALPVGLRCLDLCPALSMSATASELGRLSESVTRAIQSIDARFWRAFEPARLSLTLNRASFAVETGPTGTITITASHWKSDGSAAPVIFNITPTNSEAGERACEPFTGARFKYCAKASKRDRDEGMGDAPDAILARSNLAATRQAAGDVVESEGGGFNAARVVKNNHPTVKPTELMRWLCRLITPPGGVVLDPFMGSGSTGKAAVLEGFGFIGIERDPEYYEIALRRVAAAIAKRTNQT